MNKHDLENLADRLKRWKLHRWMNEKCYAILYTVVLIVSLGLLILL